MNRTGNETANERCARANGSGDAAAEKGVRHAHRFCGSVRHTLLAGLLCACGAASGASTELAAVVPDEHGDESELPSLDGLVIYPVAIEEAPPRVREILDLLPNVLAHRLAPPPGGSLSTYERWADREYSHYIAEHGARVNVLLALAGELHGGGGMDAVVGAIAVALAYDDFFQTIEAIRMPEEIRDDEVLTAIFRDALEDASAPLASRAAGAYRYCAEHSTELPAVMRGWAARCSRRVRELATLAASPTRRPSPRPSTVEQIPWPAECGGDGDEFPPAPDAPPPNRDSPEAVAILLTEEVANAHCRRVMDALRTRVDALLGLPVGCASMRR